MIRLMIQNWWLLFLRGVLAIAFAIFIFVFMPFLPAPFLRQFAFAGGLIILLAPGSTLVRVIHLIALIALVVGVLEFVAGIHLRRHVTDEWLLISGGVISIAFAPCLLLANVGTVQAALTWISIYAFASGVAISAFTFAAPAECPKIITFLGSPPKLAIFR